MEYKDGTIGEIFKDERIKRGLTTEQLCKEIEKKYGVFISKTAYNDIENDDGENREFSYKTLCALAKYFNLSVDYLLDLSACKELHQELDKRNVCDYFSFNDETINALLFWSSNIKLKGHKSVLSKLIENISKDLIDAIIYYKCDENMIERINDIFFRKYCENNNLERVKTINDLSYKDKEILNLIIADAINYYEIDITKTKNRLEMMLMNTILSLTLKESILKNNIPDKDIMIAYNIITTKHDYKKEFEDITAGRVNKPLINKKLF